ncbi:LPS-assembly protein LptD [Parvularcula marina]|nr:LPS assembly protein LptD [Parvularcula marina]
MAASRGVIAFCLLGAGSAAAATVAVQDIVVTDREDKDSVLFTADTISRLDETSPVEAKGNVRAFFGEQSLMADQVTYNPVTDIVTATGNVVIYDADGQIYFAEAVELTGDLRDGIATNFGALIAEENRLVGSSVVRRSTGVNTIEDGAFTACKVCREDGSDKIPTWEVKAVRVTQDKNEQMIRFHHATIKAFGVPVFYTPYFEFPDPSVKRKSGFLAPSIGNSSRAGFEIELPYYWAISDYQDVTFSPRYTEELGTLWKGEYRINTHDGGLIVQAGIIDPEGVVRNNSGQIVVVSEQSQSQLNSYMNNAYGDVGPRFHVFAKGYREFDGGWTARFDIDHVSDKTYLRTYDIEPEDELREAIDILQPDRLENVVSFTKLTDDTYTDISTIMFQSLRGADDNDFNAHALPRIRHERRYEMPVLGGDVTFGGNFLMLNREEGLDSMRAIAKATYDKVHTTKHGHRLRGFAELRGDAYRYRDSDLGVQACRNDGRTSNVNGMIVDNYDLCREFLPRDGTDDGYSVTRFLPTAGLEWSFPLAKFTGNASYIIEPRIQLVASPQEDFTDDIFNEDSAFFEFDAITLFDWNKSTGFDQWEDGQRMNMGIAASANYTNGLNISGAFGQQLRTEDSLQFDEDTGLGDTNSDYVGEINAGYGRVFSMTNRFRIDDEDGTLRRLETALRGRAGPFSTGVRYVRTEAFEEINDQRDENLTVSAFYKITDRWTTGGIWREDLDEGRTTTQQWTIQYSDDCTIFSLDYRRDNRLADGLEDNESLTFNVDVIGF